MADEAQPASEQGAAPKPALIPLVLPPAAWATSAQVVKTVPFAFPVAFGGRDWPGIGIRRLSVEQIRAVYKNYEANRAVDPDFPFALPLYVDETGAEVPDGLFDKLDPDDRDTVDVAAEAFLPRRYRATKGPGPSTSATGEATAPTSSA